MIRILHSAYHPDRRPSELQNLREGVEDLLGYYGIVPCSPRATRDKAGTSLLWAVAAGFGSSPFAAGSKPFTDFFIDATRLLLYREVHVDTRILDDHGDPAGHTALHCAVFAISPRAVNVLLEAGANVHLRDARGVTALNLACAKRPPAAAVPPTDRSKQKGPTEPDDARLGEGTPLTETELLEARIAIVTALLDAGARVDDQDLAGQTALMNACSLDALPLVELLLRSGASPVLRNAKGATAVGILAPGLGTWESRPAPPPNAERCVKACLAAAEARESAAARAHLDEEIRTARFLNLLWELGTVSDSFASKPGAKMADREAALVGHLMKHYGLPSDCLHRADGPWGDFSETLHAKLHAEVPPALLRVFSAFPSTDEWALITSCCGEAHRAAEAKATALAKADKVRTAAYDADTLQNTALIPYRHRGRVAKCMKDYQNLIALPIRRCISHAVPTAKALAAIAKLGPTVEMGAGSGYWTALLLERGHDALAYDLAPPDGEASGSERANTQGFAYRTFCEVKQADESIFCDVSLGGPELALRTLLLVCPGGFDVDVYETTEYGWETKCLQEYLAAGGQTIVYVGEREEKIETPIGQPTDVGTTSSRSFQAMLKAKCTLAKSVMLPSTLYTVDELTVWKRK